MRLKGKYGYWDTTRYPIGGYFRRAPAEGKEIASIVCSFPRDRGTDTEVMFTDQTRGAVDILTVDMSDTRVARSVPN